MRVTRNLRLSLRALTAHRVRTALAVLGTALGVAGVLVVTAVGEGARGAVARRINSLGRNLLVVTAAKLESRAGRALSGEGRSRELSTDDVAAILAGSRHVARAAPGQDKGMRAKYGPIQSPATVLGTTPEWREIRQFPLAEGRFFTGDENLNRRLVAVLGASARTSLFPDSLSPLGRTIRIGAVPFVVVGVLEPKGISVDGSATEDDRIVVPLETALHRLFNLEYLKVIYLEARSGAVIDQAQAEVADILRERHAISHDSSDDFAIQNQRVLLSAELATKASFRRLILGLGALSLLVVGVGILSILLLTIRERRGEIGLRMAVGARRPDVAVQFLAEALLLATAGGVMGIVLGLGAAQLVSRATSWDAAVTTGTLLLTVASVAAIGLGFGVYPAWRAASLDPIAALQS